MKIGIKTYCYVPELEYFKDKVDYIEVMAIVGENYDRFVDFSMLITVHSQHRGFGVNNADRRKERFNLKSLNFARSLADLVNSDRIVVHPGELKNKDCSRSNSVDLISGINDSRIIIENMPNSLSLCSTPADMDYYMQETGKSFCFDVNHAIHYAADFGISYYKLMKDFLELDPSYFHIGGHSIKSNRSHLSFAESELNLRKILSFYPANASITL